MTMLKGYACMKDFFESIDWWTLEPAPELVNEGVRCLAQKGRMYVLYLPEGGKATIKLEGGPYAAKLFNPRTGRWFEKGEVNSSSWTSPLMVDTEDWIILLQNDAL